MFAFFGRTKQWFPQEDWLHGSDERKACLPRLSLVRMLWDNLTQKNTQAVGWVCLYLQFETWLEALYGGGGQGLVSLFSGEIDANGPGQQSGAGQDQGSGFRHCGSFDKDLAFKGSTW